MKRVKRTRDSKSSTKSGSNASKTGKSKDSLGRGGTNNHNNSTVTTSAPSTDGGVTVQGLPTHHHYPPSYGYQPPPSYGEHQYPGSYHYHPSFHHPHHHLHHHPLYPPPYNNNHHPVPPPPTYYGHHSHEAPYGVPTNYNTKDFNQVQQPVDANTQQAPATKDESSSKVSTKRSSDSEVSTSVKDTCVDDGSTSGKKQDKTIKEEQNTSTTIENESKTISSKEKEVSPFIYSDVTGKWYCELCSKVKYELRAPGAVVSTKPTPMEIDQHLTMCSKERPYSPRQEQHQNENKMVDAQQPQRGHHDPYHLYHSSYQRAEAAQPYTAYHHHQLAPNYYHPYPHYSHHQMVSTSQPPLPSPATYPTSFFNNHQIPLPPPPHQQLIPDIDNKDDAITTPGSKNIEKRKKGTSSTIIHKSKEQPSKHYVTGFDNFGPNNKVVFDESAYMIDASFYELISDFTKLLFQQYQLCFFDEEDRKSRGGKRGHFELGWGGLSCKNCLKLKGKSKVRKFFWSSLEGMVANYYDMHDHTIVCKGSTDNVKAAIGEFKTFHASQNTTRKGMQRVFFKALWERMQKDYVAAHGSASLIRKPEKTKTAKSSENTKPEEQEDAEAFIKLENNEKPNHVNKIHSNDGSSVARDDDQSPSAQNKDSAQGNNGEKRSNNVQSAPPSPAFVSTF